MIRSTSMRLAVLVLGAGLIAVLPASAAAKTPKAKTKTELVSESFLLPNDSANSDQADGAAVCPENTTLLSGGGLANTPAPAPTPNLDIDLFRSGPVGNAWYARFDSDTAVNLQPSAQAICLRDKLKVKGANEGDKKKAGKSAAVAAKAPKAITKVTQVNLTFALPPSDGATNGHVQFDVACPEGTTIAGGGASFNVAGDTDILLQESGPQGNGWHIRYENDETRQFVGTASALCLKDKLKVQGDEGKDKARSKFEQVEQAVTLPAVGTNNGRARYSVACPERTTIVGGGAKISSGIPFTTNDVLLEESGAVDNGWQVTFENDETVAQSATIHALCLKNKLKVK